MFDGRGLSPVERHCPTATPVAPSQIRNRDGSAAAPLHTYGIWLDRLRPDQRRILLCAEPFLQRTTAIGEDDRIGGPVPVRSAQALAQISGSTG